MSDTTFQDYSPATPIVAAWLNDVNSLTYHKAFPDGLHAQTAEAAATAAAALAAASGAGLVGFIGAGSGSVAGTVQSKLRNIVQVNDFVTGGLGTSASPWTGWDTAITWTASTQYNFIDGYYSYASSPNFAKDYLSLKGSAGAVIRQTGTGYALLCDAGSGAQLVTSVSIDIRLEGNASSSGGIYQRGCVHSSFKCKFHNVPAICFTDVYGVLNTYTLETSGLVVGQTLAPASLIAVNKRNVGEISSANKYYLIAENCTAQGVVLNDCVNSQFIGGTSESNAGGGYFISSTSNYNTFLNIDLESNTGYDLSNSGNYNNFIGVLSSTVATMNGSHNTILGGIYNTINSGGVQNSFGPLAYSDNGGSFADTGTGTTKRNAFNVNGSAMDLDIVSPMTRASMTSAATGSGTVSAANATAIALFTAGSAGRYEVVAYITSGDAANFTASATILNEGGGSARIIANNGGMLTLTLSGTGVKATQTSGVTQTMNYSYLRIA